MTNNKSVGEGNESFEPTLSEVEEEENARAADPPKRNEYGGICRRCEGEESDGTTLKNDEMCAKCIQEVKEQQNPGSTTNRGGKRKKTSRKHKKKKHTRKHKKKSIKKKHKKKSIKKKNTRKR